jgi:glyoxylase-like metal-dependent hydrolase (beta-lactamase superfamily II)
MSPQIVRDRNLDALKTAAGWPGADRTTLITLATVLAATGADAEGLSFFGSLAAQQPDQVLPLTLAGYFQLRSGGDQATALARLDEAASKDLGPAQYYRGLALAGLPPEAGRAEQAISDLEFVLAVADQFPSAMLRAVHHALAAAYAATGQQDKAASAAAHAGLTSAPAGSRLQFSSGWMNAADGYRFRSPAIREVAPGVQVAQGYDFGDFAFVSTAAGVVAIDAGTAPHRLQAAMTDAGVEPASISHVILTHSHFDHAGGIAALTGPGTIVVAQRGFPAELERQHANPVPFRYFVGQGTGLGPEHEAIAVDMLIDQPANLSVGGIDFVLYPAPSGETSDALMVYLPAAGILFTGDVLMPYVGAPFFAEGSPDGLLEALKFIVELGPSTLVHGHTVLTEVFTPATLPGLLAALTDVRQQALDAVSRGATLTEILDAVALPDALREHPAAVAPFLAIREHFVQRLHHLHTGYWQSDGQGMEPISPAERAAALDILAAGKPERFAEAGRELLDQRDYALALEIVTAGLVRHPGSADLARLRLDALTRLMERYQLQDPFRFLIYADMAGVELGPAD